MCAGATPFAKCFGKNLREGYTQRVNDSHPLRGARETAR